MICPVRFLVQLFALRLLRLDLSVVEELLDLGQRRRRRPPGLLRALEERADEVVRVAVVAGPAEHAQVAGIAFVRAAQVVRVPRSALRGHLEARLVQARGERLEVPLRIGHVRTRHVRRVPELDRHRQRVAGVRQDLLRLLRVVGVVRDVVRVADDLRRHELLRQLGAAGVEVVHDRLAVEAVRDRLTHLDVVGRLLCDVEADIGDVEGGPVDDLQARRRPRSCAMSCGSTRS